MLVKTQEQEYNNFCGFCNCDLDSKTPNGHTIYVRDSNQNIGVVSNCNCWFCIDCLLIKSREGIHRCRRCDGCIMGLLSYTESYENDSEDDSEADSEDDQNINQTD